MHDSMGIGNRRALLTIVTLQVVILVISLANGVFVGFGEREISASRNDESGGSLARQTVYARELEGSVASLRSVIDQMRLTLDGAVRRTSSEAGENAIEPPPLGLEEIRAAAEELRRAAIALSSGSVANNEEILRIFRAGAPPKVDAVRDMMRLIGADRPAAERALMFLMPTDVLSMFGAPTRISLGSRAGHEVWNYTMDDKSEFDLNLHGGRVFSFGAVQR